MAFPLLIPILLVAAAGTAAAIVMTSKPSSLPGDTSPTATVRMPALIMVYISDDPVSVENRATFLGIGEDFSPGLFHAISMDALADFLRDFGFSDEQLDEGEKLYREHGGIVLEWISATVQHPIYTDAGWEIRVAEKALELQEQPALEGTIGIGDSMTGFELPKTQRRPSRTR